MNLTKTEDFAQMFIDYCRHISLSCAGCKIAEAMGIKRGQHDGLCAEWAVDNLDKSTPILQEWCDNQPFIPVGNEGYAYIDPQGYIKTTTFCSASAFDVCQALAKNCFRSVDAARAHKEEMMAKYDAIKHGRYPD